MLLAGLMLAGCASTPAPAPTPMRSAELVKPGDIPITGGSFQMVMPSSPETLSPLQPQTREMLDMQGLIYEALIRYDERLRPLPALAETWENNGDTWTFNLRPNVKFHDGRTLTADDVVHTMGLLKSYLTAADKDSVFEAYMKNIVSYEAIDELTLQIKTNGVRGGLLYWLSFPIVPSDYTGSDPKEIPPGTGPYRVSNHEPGKQMNLSVNEDWWRRTPYIPSIIVKAMPDAEAALTSIDLKQVDLVHSNSLTAGGYRQQGIVDVVEMTTQEYECIIPNLKNGLLADIRMRRAVLASLDRKTIITEAYLWHAVSVDVPLPPDSGLYDQTHTLHEYNPGTARDLLGQMNLSDTNQDGKLERNGENVRLRILVNENPLQGCRSDSARMVSEQLAAVGIDSVVELKNWEDYKKALKNGDFDLCFAGFTIGRDFDLSFLVQSGASENYSCYASSAMDHLLSQYAQAVDENQAKQLSADIQHLFSDELPLLSLYFRTNTLVVSAEIKGIQNPRDMNIFRNIEDWYILREGDEHKAN